ncbi:SDR family NAD(P)-dependent oxidoreductase [Beijerinckia indica]|uniref:Short-chain dehydrogenase/reductase SDR n=1 Tax=Beijerinckia indica subsp. indica (strain ATCC 9039 / DSM 1715 / NCIMB 8712) TaxID=395963 RepID=B2IG73_BEII9|nr:SDR family NAD(P)-dependent oxidoreductase [Beijerinckia indica]ACB97147.1 short-chain dehydrogenase/reductase SDR [Beijerinckia indica subsp. indica ATCC 9039]
MAAIPYQTALIVGAGSGLSAALARLFVSKGLKLGLVARDTDKLKDLAGQTGAKLFRCDATNPAGVEKLFTEVDQQLGGADVVIYNVAGRVRGSLVDLDPKDVAFALNAGAFGGFLVAQQALKRMLVKQQGALFFTGATASIKGNAQSAPFAMGKFALRALAQSAAREFQPQNIHVAHFIIDGAIRPANVPVSPGQREDMIDPDAIAQIYFDFLAQPRGAWSFEVDLRTFIEKF